MNCSNTNQIKMPENLKLLDDNNREIVNSLIQKAIKDKDLTELFDAYDLIF